MFEQRYISLPSNTDLSSQYVKLDIFRPAFGIWSINKNATFFAFLMDIAIQFIFSIKIQWKVSPKDQIKYNHMLFYDAIKSQMTSFFT